MGVGRTKEEAKAGEWIEVIRRESKGEVGTAKKLALRGFLDEVVGGGRGWGEGKDAGVGGGVEGDGDGVRESEVVEGRGVVVVKGIVAGAGW